MCNKAIPVSYRDLFIMCDMCVFLYAVFKFYFDRIIYVPFVAFLLVLDYFLLL